MRPRWLAPSPFFGFSLLVGSLLALLGISRPGGLSDVVAVRHWSYPDYTRGVIELARPATTQIVHLGANHKAEMGERLYFYLNLLIF